MSPLFRNSRLVSFGVIRFGVFRRRRRATNRLSRSLLSLLSRSIGLEPSTPISGRSTGPMFLSIYARACDSHDFSGHDTSNHEIPTIDDCISFRESVTSASTTFNQSPRDKQRYPLSIDENATCCTEVHKAIKNVSHIHATLMPANRFVTRSTAGSLAIKSSFNLPLLSEI